MVTVFEAFNDELKELYIGETTLGFDELIGRPPNAISPRTAHWRPEHRVTVRIIENLLPPDVAPVFIGHYLGTAARQGWRLIHD